MIKQFKKDDLDIKLIIDEKKLIVNRIYYDDENDYGEDEQEEELEQMNIEKQPRHEEEELEQMNIEKQSKVKTKTERWVLIDNVENTILLLFECIGLKQVYFLKQNMNSILNCKKMNTVFMNFEQLLMDELDMVENNEKILSLGEQFSKHYENNYQQKMLEEGVFSEVDFLNGRIKLFGQQEAVTKVKPDITKIYEDYFNSQYLQRDNKIEIQLHKYTCKQRKQILDFVNSLNGEFEFQETYKTDLKRLIIKGKNVQIQKVNARLLTHLKKYEEKQDGEEDCPYCIDEFKHPYMLFNCNHKFCKGCLQDQLKEACKQKTNLPIKCFEEDCNMFLSINDLKALLNNGTCNKLSLDSVEVHVDKKPDKYQTCKTPDCKGFFRKELKEIICSLCIQHFCINCNIAYHEGMTCAQYKNMGYNNDNYLESHPDLYQRCPNKKHNVWVHKYVACNHIACKCGMHWCWHCRFLASTDQPIYTHKTEKKHWVGDLIKSCPKCGVQVTKTFVNNRLFCKECKLHFCFVCLYKAKSEEDLTDHLESEKHRLIDQES